jgi:glucose dehydrogenase
MTSLARAAAMAAFVACGLALVQGQTANDWYNVGYDAGGSKYSPLTQITPANVANLTTAWTYDLGARSDFAMTPLAVNNVLYFPQGSNIVALKADAGTELWKFDLRTVTEFGGVVPSAGGRGISYWPGSAQQPPRLVVGVAQGFILQLDAGTGRPVPGPERVINLGLGIMDEVGGGAYRINTPPALYKNLAIIAGETGEGGRYGEPGDPRAFDLLTGKEVWRFHVVPHAGEENFGTWGLNGWQQRKSAGLWVPMSVDVANDLVFIPTGNATDQNFGNGRPGVNLYATTLLALRASTGKRVWHFQITHHDVYDWDVNSQPSQFDAMKNGQRVPAVAQMTKLGLLFMFNRLTGEPLWGVEERPIPRFDAPGDQAWPTQPFPLHPTGLTRDSMTRAEVSKISPEAEKYCTELFDKSVNMGPYTPYGMVPSLVFPGSEGGGGWGGVATNGSLGLVFVNPRHLGVIGQLSQSSGVLPSFSKSKIPTTYYTDPNGYPCNQPPWSELVAVSASTGDIVWRIPLGEYPDLAAKGIKGTGTALNSGGPISTASGLVFIGATGDSSFRAFDGKTGKELWKATLDDDVKMTPLTYLGANGKQYVVAVAANLRDAAFHLPARTGPAPNTKIYAFALR